VCQRAGGREQPPDIGDSWWDTRHQTGWLAPNARAGGLADVFALSATWSTLPAVHDAVRAALSPLVTGLSAHVGHAYSTGAALDFTWEAQAEPATPDAATDLYERICQTAFAACRNAGGSVAHHYGIGLARADAWQAERGEAGLLAWRRIKAALDPNNILNPGKLSLPFQDNT
jgi:alkyldihydroxyacetonephosphate synthase